MKTLNSTFELFYYLVDENLISEISLAFIGTHTDFNIYSEVIIDNATLKDQLGDRISETDWNKFNFKLYAFTENLIDPFLDESNVYRLISAIVDENLVFNLSRGTVTAYNSQSYHISEVIPIDDIVNIIEKYCPVEELNSSNFDEIINISVDNSYLQQGVDLQLYIWDKQENDWVGVEETNCITEIIDKIKENMDFFPYEVSSLSIEENMINADGDYPMERRKHIDFSDLEDGELYTLMQD